MPDPTDKVIDAMHSAAIRELRAGHHLHKKAREQGWPDDREGAYEYVVRRAYEAGMEAAK